MTLEDSILTAVRVSDGINERDLEQAMSQEGYNMSAILRTVEALVCACKVRRHRGLVLP